MTQKEQQTRTVEVAFFNRICAERDRLREINKELLNRLQLAEQYLGKAIADNLLENCAVPLSGQMPKIRATIAKAERKGP